MIVTTTPEPTTRARRTAPLRLALALTLALATVAAIGAWRLSATPADLDLATSRLTAAGRYRVAYESGVSPVPVSALHSWTLTVTTPEGAPVRGAAVTFDADMPNHGHGLSTVPAVTGEVAPGTYLVEGVRFQMGGHWVVDVTVKAGGHHDTVRFDLLLTR
jgi:hypothetical protein